MNVAKVGVGLGVGLGVVPVGDALAASLEGGADVDGAGVGDALDELAIADCEEADETAGADDAGGVAFFDGEVQAETPIKVTAIAAPSANRVFFIATDASRPRPPCAGKSRPCHGQSSPGQVATRTGSRSTSRGRLARARSTSVAPGSGISATCSPISRRGQQRNSTQLICR